MTKGAAERRVTRWGPHNGRHWRHWSLSGDRFPKNKKNVGAKSHDDNLVTIENCRHLGWELHCKGSQCFHKDLVMVLNNIIRGREWIAGVSADCG